MNSKNSLHRKIPGINILLETKELKSLYTKYKPEFIKYVTRSVITDIRSNINEANLDLNSIINTILVRIDKLANQSLIPVINASGIVLHTNLGRAPLGNEIFSEIAKVISGYSNLEFNLNTGKRQNRNYHTSDLLQYLTGAEDALIVNNNAAAVMLILNCFAKGKEVIISRGEMIEIGESFRIHEIMESSGAIIKEVGTTNKTKLSDYEKAINENTALVIKPHKSNYIIKGFYEEVSIKDLAILCKKKKIPFVYDLGSGLLQKPCFSVDSKLEPYANLAIDNGADIITFSGDKLLGGPQCGIIAGKKRYLSRIKSTPMLRALRVDKIIYSALHYTLQQYLYPNKDCSISTFKLLNQTNDYLKNKAILLSDKLNHCNIENIIVESKAQCGGGTMPEIYFKSYAVEIVLKNQEAKSFYINLLNTKFPVLTVLRKGKILLDIFTVFEYEFDNIVKSLKQVL